MRNRESRGVVTMLGIALSFVCLLSCQPKALHPTYEFIAPGFQSYGIKRIHVLPIVLSGIEARDRMAGEHGNPEVAKDPFLIVSELLERGLKNRAKYFFVMAEEGPQLAARSNVSTEYKALVSEWEKDLMADKERVVKVGSSMGVDAFLGPEIFLWRSTKVDPDLQEGYSHSDVGVRLYLYESRNGEVAWKVTDENSLKSQFYSKSGAFPTPPDPPEMEIVTRMVVDVILDAMP